ncbi:hypothetical protein JOF36_000541 [Pseudonocardia parietis]|uniref:Uncharacterized protein n=1 Tax=Pseudonocardia parietis TaxID=570936 RepID=A0ABS4VLP3_9PSEU|nr:hypothetical protein [Pseudonocardia parietis]
MQRLGCRGRATRRASRTQGVGLRDVDACLPMNEATDEPQRWIVPAVVPPASPGLAGRQGHRPPATGHRAPGTGATAAHFLGARFRSAGETYAVSLRCVPSACTASFRDCIRGCSTVRGRSTAGTLRHPHRPPPAPGRVGLGSAPVGSGSETVGTRAQELVEQPPQATDRSGNADPHHRAPVREPAAGVRLAALLRRGESSNHDWFRSESDDDRVQVVQHLWLPAFPAHPHEMGRQAGVLDAGIEGPLAGVRGTPAQSDHARTPLVCPSCGLCGPRGLRGPPA